VLKEKTTPELLRELEERFADAPGLIDAKKLQKDMYLFYFVKITVLDYNFYKSRDFTLYTIIQQLPELLQLENIQGVQNRIVLVQALYLKRQKPLL
jgi:hypothetical protein